MKTREEMEIEKAKSDLAAAKFKKEIKGIFAGYFSCSCNKKWLPGEKEAELGPWHKESCPKYVPF